MKTVTWLKFYITEKRYRDQSGNHSKTCISPMILLTTVCFYTGTVIQYTTIHWKHHSRTGSKFYDKIYSAKHGGEHFLLLSRGVDCNFHSFTGSNFKIKTTVLHVLLKILNFQTLTGSRRHRNGYNPNDKNDWDTNCWTTKIFARKGACNTLILTVTNQK